MSKFHINPETGNPGPCSAKVKCRFGDDSEHYSSADEARTAYEKQNSSSFPEASKAPWEIERERRSLLKTKTLMIRAAAADFAENMEYSEALPGVVPLDDSLADEDGVYWVESINDFRDPEFAMNRCQDIAFAVEEYAQRFRFMGSPLTSVTIEVGGDYLNQHTANTYTDTDGKEWIVDYAYSQVNSKAEFPYVGLREDWEKSLFEAAENPDPKVLEVYKRHEAELRSSLEEWAADLNK